MARVRTLDKVYGRREQYLRELETDFENKQALWTLEVIHVLGNAQMPLEDPEEFACLSRSSERSAQQYMRIQELRHESNASQVVAELYRIRNAALERGLQEAGSPRRATALNNRALEASLPSTSIAQ
jgi:hypothetical protein